MPDCQSGWSPLRGKAYAPQKQLGQVLCWVYSISHVRPCRSGRKQSLWTTPDWKRIEHARARVRAWSQASGGCHDYRTEDEIRWDTSDDVTHVIFAGTAGRRVTISPHYSGDTRLCHRWHLAGGSERRIRYQCAYAKDKKIVRFICATSSVLIWQRNAGLQSYT